MKKNIIVLLISTMGLVAAGETADELVKTGDTPPAGDVSQPVVEALKFLCALSQVSFVLKKTTSTAPTYVVASAWAAYYVHKGITVGSNRCVFWLPLPPMDLGPWEKYAIPSHLSDKCRTMARHAGVKRSLT